MTESRNDLPSFRLVYYPSILFSLPSLQFTSFIPFLRHVERGASTTSMLRYSGQLQSNTGGNIFPSFQPSARPALNFDPNYLAAWWSGEWKRRKTRPPSMIPRFKHTRGKSATKFILIRSPHCGSATVPRLVHGNRYIPSTSFRRCFQYIITRNQIVARLKYRVTVFRLAVFLRDYVR